LQIELITLFRNEYERGILEDQLKAKERYDARQKLAEFQQMQ